MKTFRFSLLLLLIINLWSCQDDDHLELAPDDTFNRLSVTQLSLSQLENTDLFKALPSQTALKIQHNSSNTSAKATTSYNILTHSIAKATFRNYEAYTFRVENPSQPPFSFDNYVLQKHHSGEIESFILRYTYDMEAWLARGEKRFSSIIRYDAAPIPVDGLAEKTASLTQSTDCDVYVRVYHETPEDGTYEWEPGAVCHHTTPGDMCTVIIEYTIDCSGGGAVGGSPTEPGPEAGPGGETGVGDPGGDRLPENGGPELPIVTMEPPLGPEADADNLFYLRQVIEQPLSPAATEADLLNKNNALAAYLNQINPFLFNDLSLLLVSVNAESHLTVADRAWLWEKAKTLYDIIKSKEATVLDQASPEEFLATLNPQDQQSFTENTLTTAILPAVKSVVGLQWPQTTEEWMTVFHIIQPMLIEIGIEFLPLGGLFNAMNDMAGGLTEGDYSLAAIGLAGVIMEFVPWGKLLKIGKALLRTGKQAFKTFKLAYPFLTQLSDALALGLKTVLEGNTVRLVKNNGDEVARISNNTLHVSKHSIKAADGSVVFRSADEVNASLATDFAYVNPPPFQGEVTEFVTAEAEQFVRFHGPDNQVSAFVMKSSDVQHLSTEQIRDLYVISNDNPITKISFVNIPSGTKLHGGLAKEGLGFDGGGYQFYIDRNQFEDTFVPQGWFENPPISVNNFLND